MDFLSNLLPAVPPLDQTSQLQNVTFLQNAFIATFFASLGATTIRNILGESFQYFVTLYNNHCLRCSTSNYNDLGLIEYKTVRSVQSKSG